MKSVLLLMGLAGVLTVGAAVEATGSANPGLETRGDADSASTVRRRLAQSLAIIQSTYESTREPKQLTPRHRSQVKEALPWRSTLQPSCLRQRANVIAMDTLADELKQSAQPWPMANDAPSLRALLSDEVPGIRALAAEALATLHQPEDVARLAALVADSAEANMELVAPTVGQFGDLPNSPDAGYVWHKSSVANHAAWGLHLMLGDCCPEAIADLQFTRFGALGRAPSADPSNGSPSVLAPLIAGDPKDHLWYWQEHVHRALHQLYANAGALRSNISGFDTLDPSRQSRLLVEEQRRVKQEWVRAFFQGTRDWPAERRAMVRLEISEAHQGGADMAYYDTPGQLLFNGPLDLGLDKRRILELLDGIRLWPDERRDRGGRSQVVERLAIGWRECFDAKDVPRLLARFANEKDDLWWSARAALLVALANLMPSTGKPSDDAATAEGFLRRTLREDRDVFIRERAAAELMRMNADAHWSFLKDRCFADRENGDYLLSGILRNLTKAPAGAGPTRKLLALVSDDRYQALWLEPERPLGKHIQGGRGRRLAAEALNARFGRTVVTKEDLTALKNPDQAAPQLGVILARFRELEKQ